MSRDGRGERITVDIRGSHIPPEIMDCGYPLISITGGRFRRCTGGHVHCTICGRVARRHLKNWTCGVGCNEKN